MIVLGNNIHDALLGNQEIPEENGEVSDETVEPKPFWKRALDKVLGGSASAEEVVDVSRKDNND